LSRRKTDEPKPAQYDIDRLNLSLDLTRNAASRQMLKQLGSVARGKLTGDGRPGTARKHVLTRPPCARKQRLLRLLARLDARVSRIAGRWISRPGSSTCSCLRQSEAGTCREKESTAAEINALAIAFA